MTNPTNTLKLLDDVRAQLAPDDAVLKEAAARRDAATTAAETFTGGLRTFISGSLAHRTANCPVHQRDKGLDADCGVVLDRRVHAAVGPDVLGGEGPVDVVAQMQAHVLAMLRPSYPNVKAKTTKRAILLTFDVPLAEGEDPTVDLVVALTRRDADGLWIPNTENNSWDASHPEKHTDLFTSGTRKLRLTRAHATRLAKAENKRTATPPLCSFNVETFGWMFTTDGMNDAEALHALWLRGAADLCARHTPDPAGTSAPIKVEDKPMAIDRLEDAAARLGRAIANDHDAIFVRDQLARLWPDFVSTSGDQSAAKARVAAALRSKSNIAVTSTGALTTAAVTSGAGQTLKHTRSFGDA